MTHAPLRPRRDGWTPDRQAAFLAALAGGKMSIAAAAASVGLSRQAAYRLRARRAAVAAAWGTAGPGLDDAAIEAAIDAGVAQRLAAIDAATSDAALIRALRGYSCRAKRRAVAAAARETTIHEKAGRFVNLCNLSGGAAAHPDLAPRRANGRFSLQNPVVS